MAKRAPRRGSPRQYAAGSTLPIGKSCGVADPTQRERELAATIDLALVDIELQGSDLSDQSAANRAMLAQKLAEYREELSVNSSFMVAAAEKLWASLLPKRIAHCECFRLLPASMRCTQTIARCHARCGAFVDESNARAAKRAQKAYRAKLAGHNSEQADGDVDIEDAIRALAGRAEEHDDGR